MGTKKTQLFGAFVRQASLFRHWVSRDEKAVFPLAANRYHLYVSYACPWAHRVLIMRKLKGLESVISASTVDPILGDAGWTFGQMGDETRDPINRAKYLSEVYQLSMPGFSGKVTTPVLWDIATRKIVNNESVDIMRMLNGSFQPLAKNPMDYYPESLKVEIDEINEIVYENINNGVYRCGFATTQLAHDDAKAKLFGTLDLLEDKLSRHDYLVGDQLTEADIRLFVTLCRFDLVYADVFQCALKKLSYYPYLFAYTQRLAQLPEIADTIKEDHIIAHFYESPRMKRIINFSA